MPTERKFQLVKLGPGDWLLPSNDGRTLWRIYSYLEHGDGCWVVPDDQGGERLIPIKGTFWACSRWNSGMPDFDDVRDSDLRDWEHWDHWAGTIRTRREAIVEALRT